MCAIEEVGTWEGGGATEKPRSAAMERASDMPPMRLRGFFPTQVLPVSLPIDIFLQPKHGLLFLQKRLADIWDDWGRPIEILNCRRRQKLLLYCWLSLKLSDKSCYFEIITLQYTTCLTVAPLVITLPSRGKKEKILRFEPKTFRGLDRFWSNK